MADFTPTQGRYLAFIHAYIGLHGYPPAESEIARLLRAARKQPAVAWFPGPLWPRWRGSLWYCYFGLLAITGMRLSEARHLRGKLVFQVR